MNNSLTFNPVLMQRPSGACYMPETLPESEGIVAFQPECAEAWMEYLFEYPNRLLFDEVKHKMYLEFLQHPTRVVAGTIDDSRDRIAGIKRRAVLDFELSSDSQHIYRKAETKVKKGKVVTYLSRYAPRVEEAFTIIANMHSLYDHTGIRKTWENVCDNFYGITEANVKFVVQACTICQLDAPNATKAIIQPIVSERCLDRIQIDLMDFRPMQDGKYKYVIQIKDHFSHYVWLHPLRAKDSRGVAKVMRNWFMYNGYPKILQCDNGTEFKGALLELCEEVEVKVINGAPYKPSTQGPVESANKTFKRRLSAKQARLGTREWVKLLSGIAISLNLTRPRRLKRGTTPYEVHFSRKPHWESSVVAEYVPLVEREDEWIEEEELSPEEVQREHEELVGLEELFGLEITGETGEGEKNVAEMHAIQRRKQREEVGEDEEAEDEFLRAAAGEAEPVDDGLNDMERSTGEHQQQIREAQIERSKARNVVVMKPQDIALLRIPTQYRLNTERSRMCVRILTERWPGRYTLMCKWGRLKSVYPHNHLNAISKWNFGMEAGDIHTGLAEFDLHGNMINGVEPTERITLAAAVAKTNQARPSIQEAQKAGRKRPAVEELPQRSWDAPNTDTSRPDLEACIDPVLVALDTLAARQKRVPCAATAPITEPTTKPGWDIVLTEERGFEPVILTTTRRGTTREPRGRSEALL